MTDARAAREQARHILAQRRFHNHDLPQPLKGPLHKIGDWLDDLARPFRNAFDSVSGSLPGGQWTAGLLLGAIALTVAALAAARLARRRGTEAGRKVREQRAPQLSARDLRRQADEAERAGDLDLALRLRFRAGLVELDDRDLIELRPSLPNADVRGLPSPTLHGLCDAFEDVAYGGRAAAPDDLDSAREGWPRVPEEARR